MFLIIKQKLTDQNKGAIKQTLNLIARLATFYGRKFGEFGQPLVPVLISYLADKVAKVDAFSALDKVAEAIGSDLMLNQLSSQITGSS